MNLTTLKDQIARRIDRDDLTDDIEQFVSLGEGRLNRDLRVRSMLGRVNFTVSGRYWPLPSDYLAIKSLKGDYPLECLSEDDILERANGEGGSSGYAIVGEEIVLWPWTDDDQTFELVYFRALALSDDAPTNWLLTKYPDIYLYACLCEAASFLMDDPTMLARVEGRYAEGIEKLKRAEVQASWGDHIRPQPSQRAVTAGAPYRTTTSAASGSPDFIADYQGGYNP